ncbi:MAG: ROK family protein [Acidimicrobiales bacterium]
MNRKLSYLLARRKPANRDWGSAHLSSAPANRVWQHRTAMTLHRIEPVPAQSLPVASGNGRATRAGRPQLMRALNERLLLEHVRAAGPLSRAELARVSGLSKPTVALALANLETDGLVKVAGLRTGFRGPAAVLYEVRPESGYVLGLDVGREYLRGALADIGGTVCARFSRPAHAAGAAARVGELTALAEELVAAAGVTRSRVAQVVIGSPGVYDPARGALTMAANVPGWESPKVLMDLQRSLGPTTIVENDIDLAALAERDMGHGRDVRNFCFVSVGTGIGMGLVIDGQLHRGAHGAAGEIAYLPLAGRGVSTAQARRHGLLETVASASAVVKAARSHGIKASSARHVFSAAARGELAAASVVDEEVGLVARAVSSVVAVVDPELVVLGGGIGQAPGFAEAVAAELERLVPFVPDVRVSALGQDAVVDGSLVLGLERAWQHVLDRG